MNSLAERVASLKRKLNPKKLEVEAAFIERQSSQADFWQDQEGSAQKMKRLTFLHKRLAEIKELETLLAVGQEEELEKKLSELELAAFLSGHYDSSPAVLSVHAGQGGVEAMDWAEMLKRMYMRFFERKGWAYRILEETMGEEAGVKSVTFQVSEPYAYGYLKFEAGTHRLVRQSPFNADQKRQTSFALVEVLPQMEDDPSVEIRDDDLEWQFFRASTQGGQNVQKVSTAVRLTHKPSGIVVTSQNERFQEQNRKIALSLLRSKLWARQKRKIVEEKERLREGRTKAAWGTQIRSYVLHPYQMVKDHRTEWETGDANSVLDGDLDGLIQAELESLSST